MAASLHAYFLNSAPVPDDKVLDFEAWLQAVKNGYQGTFAQYQDLFDDEGELR